jgi:hypothetical protein
MHRFIALKDSVICGRRTGKDMEGNGQCILNYYAKENEVGGTCGTHGEGRGVYMVLVGRPEGKRPLGRPKHRCKGNIKMGVREIRIDGANWIQLAQNRVNWRVV